MRKSRLAIYSEKFIDIKYQASVYYVQSARKRKRSIAWVSTIEPIEDGGKAMVSAIRGPEA